MASVITDSAELVLGVPGRVVRRVTDEEYERLSAGTARRYHQHAAEYRRAGVSGR